MFRVRDGVHFNVNYFFSGSISDGGESFSCALCGEYYGSGFI